MAFERMGRGDPMTDALLAVSRFQSEIDRLFREALSLASGERAATPWRPAVDIAETDDALLILVEVPGLGATDLTVEVHGSSVRIRGEKIPPPCTPEAKHERVERDYGCFAREIQLHPTVNTHLGRAHLESGVLTVTFPKIDEQRQAVRVLEIEEA